MYLRATEHNMKTSTRSHGSGRQREAGTDLHQQRELCYGARNAALDAIYVRSSVARVVTSDGKLARVKVQHRRNL